MKRHLALLFVASIAAGAWLLRPKPLAEAPPQAGSCSEESSCSAGIGDTDEGAAEPAGGEPAASSSADGEATSAPTAESSTAPRTAAAEGDRLREEADRLLAAGRVREAVDAMRQAAEVDPTARNHGDLGSLLERLTLFDEAARHLKQAAELDPSDADRWLALANVYYRAIEPGEAWKAEKRAREADPAIVIRRDERGRLVRREAGGDSAAPNP